MLIVAPDYHGAGGRCCSFQPEIDFIQLTGEGEGHLVVIAYRGAQIEGTHGTDFPDWRVVPLAECRGAVPVLAQYLRVAGVFRFLDGVVTRIAEPVSGYTESDLVIIASRQ